MQRNSGSPTQNAGKAEVAELDDAGFGQEDVLWLHIAVDALQQTNPQLGHKASADAQRMRPSTSDFNEITFSVAI